MTSTFDGTSITLDYGIHDTKQWAQDRSNVLATLADEYSKSSNPVNRDDINIANCRLEIKDFWEYYRHGDNAAQSRKDIDGKVKSLVDTFNKRAPRPKAPPPRPVPLPKTPTTPSSPSTPPAPSDDEGQDGKANDPKKDGPAPAGFAPLKKRVDTGFKHLGFDEDGNPTDDGWFAKVNNLGMTVVGEDGESGLVGRVKALENAPSADKEAVRKLDERVIALENTPATGTSSFNQKAAGLTAAVVIVLTLIVSIIAPFSWLHNIVLWIAGLSLAGIAALVVGYWPAKKNEVHS